MSPTPALTVLLLLASCRAPGTPADGACEEAWQCAEGLTCYEGTCRPRVGAGERCDPSLTSYQRHCEYGLECAAEGVCVTADELAARREVAERERQEALLRVSGLEPERVAEEMGAAEQAERPPGPGLRVRVVHTTSRGDTFAACRADERLIGGGCASSTAVAESHPSHHGRADTVGARWNCGLRGAAAEIEAYALCQALPPD